MVDPKQVVVDARSLVVVAPLARVGERILPDVLLEVFGAVNRLGGEGAIQQLDGARVLAFEEEQTAVELGFQAEEPFGVEARFEVAVRGSFEGVESGSTGFGMDERCSKMSEGAFGDGLR